METSILFQTVADFYNVNNKYAYTKLKNLIAPIICYVERNLNEVSYKKFGISLDFKDKFTYISHRLNDAELDAFIRLYKKIRAINVHARTFYSSKEMHKTFNFDISKLTKDYAFLELDIPVNTPSGELTVYGMTYILSLLLNGDQFWSLLNLMSQEKRLGLPLNYLVYEKKQLIKEKSESINNIRKGIKDIPIIYFAEQYVMPIISETYLIFEEEILKEHTVKPKNPFYLSFPEAMSVLGIEDGLKKQLIFLRNMWAHGNSFYYTSPQENTIIKFIDIMGGLANTRYKTIAQNALKKLKILLLQLKYKRPTEMALKLQNDRSNKESLLHRIETMTGFNDKDELIPLFLEERLSEIDWCQVKFRYNNKEEKLGEYNFNHITVIEHISSKDKPFIIDGIQTELYSFKEYVLPDYKCLDVSIKITANKRESIVAITDFVTHKSIIYGE